MPQAGVVAPNIQGDEMNAGKPKAISVLFICLGNICRSLLRRIRTLLTYTFGRSFADGPGCFPASDSGSST